MSDQESKCMGLSRANFKQVHECHRMAASNHLDELIATDGHAHLRRVLSVMFPPAYIKLFHQPPHSVCSLFRLKLCPISQISELDTRTAKHQLTTNNYNDVGDENDNHTPRCEPSSEPSSRAQIILLQNCLSESLIEHRAKPVGLCPIRRAIYEQCFDELIRQVTVGCIEQGLLLFRIRNEFRMTIGYYRRVYESAVQYGLNKAFDASLKFNHMKIEHQSRMEMEMDSEQFGQDPTPDSALAGDVENGNRELTQLMNKLKEYYEGELAKKDEIIGQQRAIISAFNQQP